MANHPVILAFKAITDDCEWVVRYQDHKSVTIFTSWLQTNIFNFLPFLGAQIKIFEVTASLESSSYCRLQNSPKSQLRFQQFLHTFSSNESMPLNGKRKKKHWLKSSLLVGQQYHSTPATLKIIIHLAYLTPPKWVPFNDPCKLMSWRKCRLRQPGSSHAWEFPGRTASNDFVLHKLFFCFCSCHHRKQLHTLYV